MGFSKLPFRTWRAAPKAAWIAPYGLPSVPSFERALRRVVTNTGKVIYDARDPERRALLDPKDSASSAKYYRYVRHDLTHRGKRAWRNGEIVRCSLLELQESVSQVLAERMGLEIEPFNSSEKN